MCGFVGRVNSQSSPQGDKLPITSALMYLKRRGPDSHNTWASDDGIVELLHARLAIVDTDSRARRTLCFGGWGNLRGVQRGDLQLSRSASAAEQLVSVSHTV